LPVPKRITLLSETEINEIYDYPVFSDIERQNIFYLTEDVRLALNKIDYIEVKVYLILQWGYFKAKQIIYPISFEKSALDVAYIVNKIYPKSEIPINLPSNKTQNKIRNIIYKLFSIDPNINIQQLLFEKATHLIKYNADPAYLLRELFICLDNSHIPIPAYSTLQTLIGHVIATEEKRLMEIIAQHTPLNIKKVMDEMLVVQNGLSPLSALKLDPKNFKTHQMQAELKKI
jgi:hypothetical protein